MLDRLQPHAASLPDYTELRLHRNHGSRIAIRNGVVIGNSVSSRGGVSARCHTGGAFGFAAEPAHDGAAIDRVVREARGNADLDRRRGGAGRGALAPTSPGSGSYDYRSGRAPLDAAARAERLRVVERYVAETYPGLASSDLVLATQATEKALVNSEGAATYSYVPRSNLLVKLSLQANDGVVDLYEVLGGFGELQDHFDDVDWALRAIDRLYEELRRKADGTYCEAGVHDVILDSDVAGILAHEAIGHTCEADLVLGGSVAGARLGQQVASEKVTLVDFAGRGPDGGASIAIHVDDEGTPCRDVTIIERGVLREFLHSRETARDLEAEPTGNARAYAFGDEPLVRMRNTAILPGNDRLDDMIASVDRGYYLKRSTNGQADATSEFMFGIACGYEIRDGKLGRAIRDTTISGVAFDMLETVTHVSDELTWSPGGMCGKKQIIPVGMGGPAVKCRLNVGGR